jgi:uncharacterized protein (TIGR03435 family)
MQCTEFRNNFADYVKEQLPPFVQARLAKHLAECASCRAELDGLTDVWAKLGTIPTSDSPVAAMNARFRESLEDYRRSPKPVLSGLSKDLWYWAAGIAATVALAVLGSMFFLRTPTVSASATVETTDGALYRTWGGTTDQIRPGAEVKLGEELRAEDEAMLKLADGSRVEMRSNSVIWLESAIDGLRIRLRAGSVIVNAAKQRTGHLYVQTKEVTVSVVGTVFVVNAEETGSRVAVIEGEVHVQQGALAKTLLSGEQVATAPTMIPRPVAEEISWSRNAEEHVALLTQQQAVLTPVPAASPAPVSLAFEVAAIHPGPPGSTSSKWDAQNERVTIDNLTLKSIIVYAFDVKDYQVIGENPLLSERYSIQAKAEAGTPKEQLRLMLQQLLADRFKMKFKPEAREVPGFALVPGKDGLKVSEQGAAELLSGRGAGFSGGGEGAPALATMSSTGSASAFADSLARSLGRPVVDRTNLTGRYVFRLRYASEAALRAGTVGPSLEDAVEEQVGLKLEPRRLPIDFIIIEHIEKPSEN